MYFLLFLQCDLYLFVIRKYSYILVFNIISFLCILKLDFFHTLVNLYTCTYLKYFFSLFICVLFTIRLKKYVLFLSIFYFYFLEVVFFRLHYYSGFFFCFKNFEFMPLFSKFLSLYYFSIYGLTLFIFSFYLSFVFTVSIFLKHVLLCIGVSIFFYCKNIGFSFTFNIVLRNFFFIFGFVVKKYQTFIGYSYFLFINFFKLKGFCLFFRRLDLFLKKSFKYLNLVFLTIYSYYLFFTIRNDLTFLYFYFIHFFFSYYKSLFKNFYYFKFFSIFFYFSNFYYFSFISNIKDFFLNKWFFTPVLLTSFNGSFSFLSIRFYTHVYLVRIISLFTKIQRYFYCFEVYFSFFFSKFELKINFFSNNFNFLIYYFSFCFYNSLKLLFFDIIRFDCLNLFILNYFLFEVYFVF